MPDNTSSPSASPKSSAKRAIAKATRARFLKAVQRVAAVFGVVLILLGGYVYFYASRQQGYLTGRNLRVLSSMSTQIGTSLQSADQILKRVDSSVAAWDTAALFIPLYNDLVLLPDSGGTPFVGDQAGLCESILRDSLQRQFLAQSPAGWRHDTGRLPYCFYNAVPVISPTAAEKPRSASALAIINMAEYLGPILPRNVFHKTVVADDSGRVLLQSGLSDLALTSLVAIVGNSKGDSAGWNDLRLKPSITDVRLAGKPYRLFLEPCCLASDGAYWDRHLVVAGLVTKDALVRESLKISLSLVMACSAIMILVFLGWPFLKIRLIGEREPVLMRDGLLLGAGSLLAAALSTIFALDLYSYTKFRVDRDGELRALSGEIIANLKQEVAAAYRQLDTLARVGLSESNALPPQDSLIKIRKDGLDFPFFESWSLINRKGKQALKWSTDAYIQPRIPIKDRDYFVEVAAGRGWPAPVPPDPPGTYATAGTRRPYYLEPTVSRTTGKRQVALSIPTDDDAAPVASMALEMVSLIGVVLPPGYGYAVLDSAGRVLLHSDPSRNLDERFLAETDENRELISAIAARAADTISLKYGGSDYRAYVTPVPELPWSLVTFLDKQPGRINNAEWLGTSVYLTLIYGLLLGIFAALTLLWFPGYRAPWVWPDRRLREGYLRLIGINSLFVLAFVVALLKLQGDDMLVTGFVLPLQAMAAAWACLVSYRRRPQWVSVLTRAVVALGLLTLLGPALARSETAGWPHWAVVVLATAASALALVPRRWLKPLKGGEDSRSPRSIERPYVYAAVLFLLLAGVMPAAAFFKVARSAHTEMLVKRGQLRLAKGITDRENRIRQSYSDEMGAGKTSARETRLCRRDQERWHPELCELDLYYRFFFGTSMSPAGPEKDSASSRVPSSALVRMLLVPYRPQSSVEWRSMLPRAANDNTWSWTPRKNRLEFHGSPVAGGSTVTLSSAVPGFGPVGSSEKLSALLLGTAVLILIAGIARFLARRFFLIDVTDPVLISRNRRIASVGGTNLFVVCRNGFEQNRIEAFEGGYTLDLSEQKFQRSADLRSLVARARDSEPVVVRHFEYRHDDAITTRAKLSLLDALVSECGSSVVVVAGEGSDGAPLGLKEAWRVASPASDQSQGNPTETQDGLVSLLESLVIVDAGHWEEGWKAGDRRCQATSPRGSALSLIQSESHCDAQLGMIWNGLAQSLDQRPPRRAEPSREELLDSLGERAEPYYREIWESCRPAERVVLVHLAQHGLVNDSDRRILRRLLARGLVRRRPNFTIMNETFRRYLADRSAEVEADIPKGAQSQWDSVRRPVLAIVASVAILLFVTQQELFSATSAIITALATGVASFSRISGLFDSHRSTSTGSES
ncbi:MAG: cache domain-containing protein [Gemmatimonadales bacterium]